MNDTTWNAVKLLVTIAGTVATTFFGLTADKVNTAVSLAITAIPAIWLLVDQLRHKQQIVTAVNAGIDLGNQTATLTPPVASTAEARAVIQQYVVPTEGK